MSVERYRHDHEEPEDKVGADLLASLMVVSIPAESGHLPGNNGCASRKKTQNA